MPAKPQTTRSSPAGEVADSANRWQRVKQMVGDALELPPEERERFVQAACGHDPALLAEVEEMLRACTEAEGFLEQPLPFPAPVSAADIELAICPGQWVGPFQIQERLGRGGMGVVFRAHDPKLQRDVALKFLTAELATDHKAQQRLYREARVLSSCRHPHIPLLYDLCDYSGYTFLVMEFLEGHALSQQTEKPVACATLVRWALQICDALSCAHAQGIIHRDIKPANLFLEHSGNVKVLDFGIAKVIPHLSGQQHTQLTESRAALGTIAYLSPEQARGEEIDARSDLFSLGAVLFELATGQRAFSGATHAMIFNEILSKTVPAPSCLRPELPRPLDRIIGKLLEKDPRCRYQSAAEVEVDLRVLLNRLEKQDRSRVWPPHRRTVLAWAGASLMALTAGWLWRAQQAHTHPRAHEPVALAPATSPLVKPRRSVAVLGFKDLRASSETAWLSTALSEMLSTEMAASPSLRVVSGEEVARMKSDLGLREGEGYSPPTLQRIQKSIGSDWVVVGSYLGAGSSHGGEVRLDLQIQDAHNGETVARFSEKGREAQLLNLVSQTGSDLRTRLGLADAPPGALDNLKAYLSLKPEAARLYAEGLERFRLFEYRDAQQLLERAVQLDPSSSIAHAALAETWSNLGFDEKARQQAKAAFDHSQGMLREGRLWIEGQYRMTTHEYEKAAQIYRTLLSMAPDNLDYGLHLALAEITTGKANDALELIIALRQLPAPLGDDPRLDLIGAEAAYSAGQFALELKLAEQAAAKSGKSGARWLLEHAILKRASTLNRLGRYPESLAAIAEARRIAGSLGDTPGQATASRVLANVFLNRGDLAEANETCAEALVLYRKAGNQAGEANALQMLGNIQGSMGNLQEALRYYRHALVAARKIGDLRAVAIDLVNIGDKLRMQGNLDGTTKALGQAMSLARSVSDQYLLAMALITAGRTELDEGHLTEAENLARQGLEVARAIGNTQAIGEALMALAHVLAFQDQFAPARDALQQAIEIWTTRQNEVLIATSNMMLAELALLNGHIPDEAVVEKARSLFAEKKDLYGESSADTVLLKLLTVKGEPDKVRKQAEKLKALEKKMIDFGQKLDTEMALAQALAFERHWPEARSKLQAAIALAGKHSYHLHKLQAQTTLGKLMLENGERQPGQQLLASVAQEAQERGIPLLAQLAHSPLPLTQQRDAARH